MIGRRFGARRRGGAAIALGVLLVSWLAGCGSESVVQSNPPCTEPGSICSVVGTGRASFSGDGGPPDKATIYFPIAITFDNQGRLLVLDWNNQRIRRIDSDNRFRTIMGTGLEGPVEEGKPALETPLHHTFSMAFDGPGNLYLAGNHQPQILKVDLAGKVYIAAGDDLPGVGEDGVPARQAFLDAPCGVAVASEGFPIYIADTNNNRIRRIDADGIVRTICGTGASGYSGDNGPALEARLHHPYRLNLDPSTGDVYFCDTENHAVRRIDGTGTITTVAGTGEAGFFGDGGLAVSARLQHPYDVLMGPDGALYIADTGNNRVRRVGLDGTISTIAGTGSSGFSGDGGPATDAQLSQPSALAFDGQQNLWIADTNNHRVRVVKH